MTQTLKYILESLLFVSDEPLTVQQFRSILEEEEPDAIRKALDELMEEFDLRGGGFELRQVAGGYQFRTRSEYSEWVKKLLKPSPARLSRAALETLAIIAYKQPIIRADVEHIRGVDCGGVLRMLLEKKLIRVIGRKDIPGRPMIYGTTRQFLEVFNLKDLRDLPSPKEIESLGAEIDVDFAEAEENEAPPLSTVDKSAPAYEETATQESLANGPPPTSEDAEYQAQPPQERQHDDSSDAHARWIEEESQMPAAGERPNETALPADSEDISPPDSGDGKKS